MNDQVRPTPEAEEPPLPRSIISHDEAAAESSAAASVVPAARPATHWLRRLRWLPVAMALVATGGVVGLYFQPPGLRKLMTIFELEPGGGTSHPIAVPAPKPPATDTASAMATVIGLGTVQPRDQIITVAAPYGASNARIEKLLVDEGDTVSAGQELALLDNHSQLESRVRAAQAQLDLREADLASARAVAVNARREYARVASLREQGMVSEAALDAARASRDSADRMVDAASARASRYGSQALEAQPDVVVAARTADSARAELDQARLNLEQAVIRAPAAGRVLVIHARAGELPGAAGLLSMGDVSEMMVEVEVYQNDVSRVAVGNPVRIEAQALPTPLAGTVDRIGLEVGRQTLTGDDPAANTDARVVRVRVALDAASSQLAAGFSNLQVLATIDVGASR